MSDRSELFFKFVMLITGIILFAIVVMGGANRSPVDEPSPPVPTQSVSSSPKG